MKTLILLLAILLNTDTKPGDDWWMDDTETAYKGDTHE